MQAQGAEHIKKKLINIQYAAFAINSYSLNQYDKKVIIRLT